MSETLPPSWPPSTWTARSPKAGASGAGCATSPAPAPSFERRCPSRCRYSSARCEVVPGPTTPRNDSSGRLLAGRDLEEVRDESRDVRASTSRETRARQSARTTRTGTVPGPRRRRRLGLTSDLRRRDRPRRCKRPAASAHASPSTRSDASPAVTSVEIAGAAKRCDDSSEWIDQQRFHRPSRNLRLRQFSWRPTTARAGPRIPSTSANSVRFGALRQYPRLPSDQRRLLLADRGAEFDEAAFASGVGHLNRGGLFASTRSPCRGSRRRPRSRRRRRRVEEDLGRSTPTWFGAGLEIDRRALERRYD